MVKLPYSDHIDQLAGERDAYSVVREEIESD
jgi:hypothetical protein